MAQTTKIEWAGLGLPRAASWNPTVGCEHASEGCRHCNAEVMAARVANAALARAREAGTLDALTPTQRAYLRVVRWERGGTDGPADLSDKALPRWSREVVALPDRLADPLRRKAPTGWFVDSMSDLFHPSVPNEHIAAVFGVMAACPQHRFAILTKRPERAARWFEWISPDGAANHPYPYTDPWTECHHYALTEDPDGRIHSGGWASQIKAGRPYERPWPLPHVWLGTSVEDQATADERIPHLLSCPAAVRWISAEPLLGPVDLRNDSMVGGDRNWLTGDWYDWSDSTPAPRLPAPSLDWVVVGGESGPGARPCDVDWIRRIVRDCQQAAVPVFVKQLGRRPYQSPAHDGATGYELALTHRKGEDMAEWPEDLRIRQFPEVTPC